MSHPSQHGEGSSTAVLELSLEKKPVAVVEEMTATEAVTEAAEAVAAAVMTAVATDAAPRSG